MNISKKLTGPDAAKTLIFEILTVAVHGGAEAASDIFIVTGTGIAVKRGGRLEWPFGEGKTNDRNTIDDSLKDDETVLRERAERTENGNLSFRDAETLVLAVYDAAFPRPDQQAAKETRLQALRTTGDNDFSFSVPKLGRFRCNAYRQRGTLACTIRVFPFGLPDFTKMHYPAAVTELADLRSGLVLVTGAAGSGKSTTLAYLIDRINNDPERSGHIVTIEDPIEYIHRHNYSLISQREVEQDTGSFASALKAVLRQAPNIIQVGEMRDFETIQTAVTAAETGQLVFSTLHTLDVVNAIDRIIDVFPPLQQQQIRMQLSMVLRAVISQEMIEAVTPSGETVQVPIFEVLRINSSIAPLIRTGRTQQLGSYFRYNADEGILTREACRRWLESHGLVLKG